RLWSNSWLAVPPASTGWTWRFRFLHRPDRLAVLSRSWRRSTDNPMKFKSRLAILSCAALCSIAGAQTPAERASDESGMPRASIALSPAIIMVRCKPGQSTTQTLTIVNHTVDEVRFVLATEDVVVRKGKRSFSPAGQIANGIAASAVASPASVVVKPGEEA